MNPIKGYMCSKCYRGFLGNDDVAYEMAKRCCNYQEEVVKEEKKAVVELEDIVDGLEFVVLREPGEFVTGDKVKLSASKSFDDQVFTVVANAGCPVRVMNGDGYLPYEFDNYGESLPGSGVEDDLRLVMFEPLKGF